MKAEWKIEYDTENEFERETFEQMLNGPRYREVVKELQNMLSRTTLPPEVAVHMKEILKGIETMMINRGLK